MSRRVIWTLQVGVICVLSYGCPPPLVIDTVPPEIDRLSVAGDKGYTTSAGVVLSVSASDDSHTVQEMRVGFTPDLSGQPWVAFQTSTNITLLGAPGLKTIYVQVKDPSGNVSEARATDIEFVAPQNNIVALLPNDVTLSTSVSNLLDIFLDNPQHVISGRFVLRFDPSKVRADSVTFTMGEQLFSTAGANIILLEKEINETAGTITVSAFAQANGFLGSTIPGPFARIWLSSKSAGAESALVIESAQIAQAGSAQVVSNFVRFGATLR